MRTPFVAFGDWLIALTACGIIAGCSRRLAPEGRYQDTTVTADGSISDWKMPLRFTNPVYALRYNITSDDRNFYICVASADPVTQLQILRSGMTIWFDPKGEKNKAIGLFFPIRKPADPEPNGQGGYAASHGRNGNTRADIETRKAGLLLQSNYYNTTGFLNIRNGQFGVTDTTGPIRLAISNGPGDSLLVYEVVVPVNNVLGANWKARAAKRKISINIALNAAPAADEGGYVSRRPSHGGLELRGIGGGGRARRHTSSPEQKEEDNWYTFRLPLTK